MAVQPKYTPSMTPIYLGALDSSIVQREFELINQAFGFTPPIDEAHADKVSLYNASGLGFVALSKADLVRDGLSAAGILTAIGDADELLFRDDSDANSFKRITYDNFANAIQADLIRDGLSAAGILTAIGDADELLFRDDSDANSFKRITYDNFADAIQAKVSLHTDRLAAGTLGIVRGGTGGSTQALARTGLGLGTVSTRDSGAADGDVAVLGSGGLLAAGRIPNLSEETAFDSVSPVFESGMGITLAKDDATNRITITAAGATDTGDITGVSAGNGLSGGGTSGSVTLNLSANTIGRLLPNSGAALPASRIPNLSANKITSGTINAARIPGLSASKITSGTFSTVRIPDLNANKITSGTINAARIPGLSASKITSGVFSATRIPFAATASNAQLDAGTSATLRRLSIANVKRMIDEHGGSGIEYSTSEPSSPSDGQQWFNPETGWLQVYGTAPNVFVGGDTNQKHVYRFDASGILLGRFETHDDNNSINALAVYGDTVFVVDGADNLVYKYDLDGTYDSNFIVTETSSNAATPSGIAATATRLYVMDPLPGGATFSVRVYSHSGVRFASEDFAADALNGVATGFEIYNNRLLVWDGSDEKIYVYELDGTRRLDDDIDLPDGLLSGTSVRDGGFGVFPDGRMLFSGRDRENHGIIDQNGDYVGVWSVQPGFAGNVDALFPVNPSGLTIVSIEGWNRIN